MYRILRKELDGGVKVSVAVKEDLEEVSALLLETAQWLQSQGSQQWSALLEGRDVHRTDQAVAAGNVFVFRKENELVGMVILFSEPTEWDQTVWAEEPPGKAVYLHRLAIRRSHAGEGLGSQILNWSRSGIRFENRQVVRLDSLAASPALDSFYRHHGFLWRGENQGYNLYEQSFAGDEAS